MIKSLRKVDFSHPTGHYIRKKLSPPPFQKILGAPLNTIHVSMDQSDVMQPSPDQYRLFVICTISPFVTPPSLPPSLTLPPPPPPPPSAVPLWSRRLPSRVVLHLHVVEAELFVLLEGALVVLDGEIRVRLGRSDTLWTQVRGVTAVGHTARFSVDTGHKRSQRWDTLQDYLRLYHNWLQLNPRILARFPYSRVKGEGCDPPGVSKRSVIELKKNSRLLSWSIRDGVLFFFVLGQHLIYF